MAEPSGSSLSQSPKPAPATVAGHVDAPTFRGKGPDGTHFDKIVTIEVGEGAKARTFEIHKGLLCYYSDYFRGCFDGSFKEAIEGNLVLDDEDPVMFEAFKEWLYTQKFHGIESRLENDNLKDWSMLRSLWVFGEKRIVPLLQNDAIDMIIFKQKAANFVPTPLLNQIYSTTCPGAALRRVIIDLCAYSKDVSQFVKPDCLDRWTTESMADLVVAVHTRKPKRSLTDCDYHKHEEGYRCPSGSVQSSDAVQRSKQFSQTTSASRIQTGRS